MYLYIPFKAYIVKILGTMYELFSFYYCIFKIIDFFPLEFGSKWYFINKKLNFNKNKKSSDLLL